MAFQRLPETVQTLYSELLDQTIQAEAEAALLKAPQGTFVSKAIKGGTYWYLQRMEGDGKRQHYLGRESPALSAWMGQVKETRSQSAEDATQRANLCSMLAAGGAATDSAESGVFRMGVVLVGTQAFIAFGNMLGVRFEKQSLRTHDVDVAQDRAIGIALSQEAGAVDVRGALTDSDLGFSPVPELNPRWPSTSCARRSRPRRDPPRWPSARISGRRARRGRASGRPARRTAARRR